jgi:hypothetical protein
MRLIRRSQVGLAICLALTGTWASFGAFVNRSTIGSASQPPVQLPMITPTPTSIPGPPTLIAPADGELLPQPVPPFRWRFIWNARSGPCWGNISINGPGGRNIEAGVSYGPSGYEYVYTQTEFLSDDALSPWIWQTFVNCPLGYNKSVTRTFSVMPASWFNYLYFLPIILRGD